MVNFDISGLAKGLGLSSTATLSMVVLFLIAAVLIYKNTKDKGTKQKFIIGSVVGLLFILGISGTFLPAELKTTTIDQSDILQLGNQTIKTIWQQDYKFIASSRLSSYALDSANTEYYDYDNPVIAIVANKIALESNTPEEAIEKTVKYVYDKVEYVYGEADTACFDGTAPKILLSGKGQCDTQSLTVISILRKMGVAARPVGGCIVVNPNCRAQALYQSIFNIQGPKFTDLKAVDFNETQKYFSRGSGGGFSREGGLHAYLVAWVPEEGWVPFEATTGRKADTKCYYYHVEMYPKNNEKQEICVSQSYQYAKACQLDDLALLNQYGEGLISEVSP
jgi:transglutaminase-like putative cysteine protease